MSEEPTTAASPDPTQRPSLDDRLSLVDYRRRVAGIYTDLQRSDGGETGWRRWADARAELLRTHPQSPVDDDLRTSVDGIRYFGYDPTWSVVGTVQPMVDDGSPPSLTENRSIFRPIGSVTFERTGSEYHLTLFWLDAYGGGLFLPFRDATNGITTYGGGRYLLDGAKSADLGAPGPGRLTLDFNFSYHPSCAWDPVWPCPLAPPSNRLGPPVEAGERLPPALLV